MASESLEPCPFDGAAPYIEGWVQLDKDGRRCFRISCVREGSAHALLVFGDTEADAIAAWNRRAPAAPEPTPPHKLAEMERVCAVVPPPEPVPTIPAPPRPILDYYRDAAKIARGEKPGSKGEETTDGK